MITRFILYLILIGIALMGCLLLINTVKSTTLKGIDKSFNTGHVYSLTADHESTNPYEPLETCTGELINLSEEPWTERDMDEFYTAVDVCDFEYDACLISFTKTAPLTYQAICGE